jgi:myo-inositol-1(or 4)-monophosphatase
MSRYLDVAVEAVQEAGRFLKESVGRVRSVETKKGEVRNLVSEIDRGAEEKIIAIIHGHFPGHAILAEESGEGPTRSDVRWIIDPLDGTTNFLHGVPIFSTTVGVEQQGALIAGATYDPNLNELFVVERGSGAFCNGTRLRVTATDSLINSLVVTGFPYNIAENPDHAADHFVNFLYEARGVRRLGSAALDLAWVAAGRFDGFWEVSLNPWDMAAGSLLVQEAGGATSDFTGAPTTIYRRQILATNGRIHREAVAVLQKAYRGR